MYTNTCSMTHVISKSMRIIFSVYIFLKAMHVIEHVPSRVKSA